jgi:DNA end-binding protein Ku
MGGIGRFVLRGAEYFCLIRPKGDALVLETLFLAEDVRSQAEIDEAVAGTEVKDAELKLAQQVMESLVAEFDPSELQSQFRSDLRQMLEAKLDGQEIAKPEPVPETPVVDLMEALKRSVEEVKGRKTAKAAASKKRAAPKSGSGSRRQPARKSA